MKKLDKILIVVIACLLIVIAVLFIMQKQEKTIDAVVLQSGISEISELTSVEYNYTNMARYENYSEFYGYKVPFTTNKFIISYDGVIKAGYDLATAKFEVVGKTITVTLSQPKILSHEINFASMQIIDESYSIFNKLEITDYNSFTNDQVKIMEEKAINAGLYDKANENVKKIITLYVLNINSDYTVEFN